MTGIPDGVVWTGGLVDGGQEGATGLTKVEGADQVIAKRRRRL